MDFEAKPKTEEDTMSEESIEKLTITESAESIWHISCIMNTICNYLDFTDLKSLRLVNKTFLKISSDLFVCKSVIKAKKSLGEFNETYVHSNLKDVTTVQFEGITKIDHFEAFLGTWLNVTEVHFKNVKFVDAKNNSETYELPIEFMKHIKTLISRCSQAIIRTSSLPAIERLEIVNGTSKDSQVILDGPISLIELKMSFNSGFIKNGEILSPSKWNQQPELDFSRLKSLQIHREEVGFTFLVENFLELKKFQLLINPFGNNGSRVIGLHNNLKIREIFFLGLEVNLLELPSSLKFCHFQLCRFKPCTPVNLKVEEIRSECAGVRLNDGSSLLHHLIQNVNLSRCTDLHTLSISSPTLKTSYLPSSLQYLRLMVGCKIMGEMFGVPTLSVFDEYRNFKKEWHNDDDIDEILRYFTYDTLHIDFDNARTFMISYSKSAQFRNLLDKVNRHGKTMYLNGVNYAAEKKNIDHGAYRRNDNDDRENLKLFHDSDIPKLVDRFAHYYEFTGGKGIAISKNQFLNKVKYWENSDVEIFL